MHKSQDRIDLSTWVTHFVHGWNIDTKPLLEGEYDLTYTPDFDQFVRFIDEQNKYVSLCKKGREEEAEKLYSFYPPYSIWKDYDEDQPVKPDAEPFDVLQRIIQTGHIRAGWAFRKQKKTGKSRPTIYGHRAAVCFTEMPLYALVQYAKERANDSLVSAYGIAFKRQELWLAGARPVIYGLSTPHKEEPSEDNWPRTLAEECGLGLNEQYRYVATSGDGAIDWTFEREWRWPFIETESDCPGLPIFLENSPFHFSTILILVPTEAERDIILDLLKRCHDSESLDMGEHNYHQKHLSIARVVSIEEVQRTFGNHPNDKIRLENIPLYSIQQFVRPVPTESTISRVKTALTQARKAGLEAGELYRKTYPDNTNERFWDDYGWAFIRCLSAQSEFLAAIETIAEEEGLHIIPIAESGYQIDGIFEHATTRGTLREGLTVARAVVSSFQTHFPDIRFEIHEQLN